MLQLKGVVFKLQKLSVVAMPKMSNEKQYLGSEDLVNDSDEWEEGWVGVGWVGGWELQLFPIFSATRPPLLLQPRCLPRRADLIVQ